MVEAGALARRVHSEWLSRAMTCAEVYPRIPLRPVEQGGFEVLMSKAQGPQRAEQWWGAAFDRIDRVEGKESDDFQGSFPPLAPDAEPFG